LNASHRIFEIWFSHKKAEQKFLNLMHVLAHVANVLANILACLAILPSSLRVF
jgi:hypothetical protein